MKKIFLTLLVLFIGLSAYAKPNYSYTTSSTKYDYSGTYVDEEIDTPITQIGLPQEFFEEQVEESGLEIVWNSWHARVRNKVLNSIHYINYSDKYAICKVYLVDKNRNISNIVVFILYENNIYKEGKDGFIIPNKDFYIYKNDENKFYKMQVHENGMKIRPQNFTKILAAAEYTPVGFYAVPESSSYVKTARKIEEISGLSLLKFPKKSKRTKVVVTQGTTNIDYLKGDGKYLPKDFNDIER